MTSTIERKHTGPRMSKIVTFGGQVFLSGQTSAGSEIADIAGQSREVFKRIDDLLAEAGIDKTHILSATIYLRDMADFAAMNAEWEAWMPQGAAPARATVAAKLALPDLLVEITVTAAKSWL